MLRYLAIVDMARLIIITSVFIGHLEIFPYTQSFDPRNQDIHQKCRGKKDTIAWQVSKNEIRPDVRLLAITAPECKHTQLLQLLHEIPETFES